MSSGAENTTCSAVPLYDSSDTDRGSPGATMGRYDRVDTTGGPYPILLYANTRT